MCDGVNPEDNRVINGADRGAPGLYLSCILQHV